MISFQHFRLSPLSTLVLEVTLSTLQTTSKKHAWLFSDISFGALTLLVGRQERHRACKKFLHQQPHPV